MSEATPVDDRDLASAVIDGDRTAIGQAITLVESTLDEHRVKAAALLAELMPHSGDAQRVGITGVPGVGKSTFIERLGLQLTASGHRVAVLAVDPSSSRTGGSILGDKTRMTELSVDDQAFIRPSPSSGALGGVTTTTRESMVVLEAAGHDVVLVETMGVGQSETIVHGMVDHFLVLMLAGAGDELQGIKKGVLELADTVAVNKADGTNVQAAHLAAAEYRRALHLIAPVPHGQSGTSWEPRVVTCSGLTGDGLGELWQQIELHRIATTESGDRESRRRGQRLDWMNGLLRERVIDRFMAVTEVGRLGAELEAEVLDGRITASDAVDRLLAAAGPDFPQHSS